MTRTETVRLLPDNAGALLAFMRRFNDAVNYASRVAFTNQAWHWLKLQRLVYRDLREKFCLPAAAAVAVIRKAAYAYTDKKRRSVLAVMKPRSIAVYNHRYKRDGTCLIYGMRLRFVCRFPVTSQQQALLVYRRNKFVLYQAVEYPDISSLPAKDYLGCDLGIENLAVDSDGQIFTGSQVEDTRRKYAHGRRNLQRNGSRSAKRKLRHLSGRQSRYQRDVNHCISKVIVHKAQQLSCGLALEDLRGIRRRIKARRGQRGRLHNWSFSQLRFFIVYKAGLAGVPVALVNAAYTSQRCSACGHTAKKNRVQRNAFVCCQCGLTAQADINAAQNIRARAADDSARGSVSQEIAANLLA